MSMKNIGLPKGVVYACLAETIVLALEGRFENYTVGRAIEWEKVHEIYKLGLKHGMQLAAISGVKGVYSDEDIAQEAFVQVYRGLGGFRGEARFGNWLIAITLNQCLYEMLNSANQAWTMYPGLAHGAGHRQMGGLADIDHVDLAHACAAPMPAAAAHSCSNSARALRNVSVSNWVNRLRAPRAVRSRTTSRTRSFSSSVSATRS